MRFADGISVTPEVPVVETGDIWRARHRVIRFYDPETGRFTTPDPLTGGPDDPTISYRNNIYEFIDAVIKQYFASIDPHHYKNRYVYCLNNPINRIDPLGLFDDELEKAEPEPLPTPDATPPPVVGGQPTPAPPSPPPSNTPGPGGPSSAPIAVATPAPNRITKQDEATGTTTTSSPPTPTRLESPTQPQTTPPTFEQKAKSGTYQVAIISGTAGLKYGHTVEIGFAGTINKEDREFGMYAKTGGGPYAGGNVTWHPLDVTLSSNTSIQDLEGWSVDTGGGVNISGVSVGGEYSQPFKENAASSYNFNAGVGLGTPAEGHSLVTYTDVWQWL